MEEQFSVLQGPEEAGTLHLLRPALRQLRRSPVIRLLDAEIHKLDSLFLEQQKQDFIITQNVQSFSGRETSLIRDRNLGWKLRSAAPYINFLKRHPGTCPGAGQIFRPKRFHRYSVDLTKFSKRGACIETPSI
ncbi:hypothetical protein KSP39_PZI011037 [Platanthera zijinensis]|uniref:Uncharacterized protein n=1 Tax=Platanthera zijinensis TaxID=2320716 RepID=A0AAP0BI90_9ASPA